MSSEDLLPILQALNDLCRQQGGFESHEPVDTWDWFDSTGRWICVVLERDGTLWMEAYKDGPHGPERQSLLDWLAAQGCDCTVLRDPGSRSLSQRVGDPVLLISDDSKQPP
jgi:hypothetical protein